MITFGPVPSRRLGRSLGVNNIPPKVCTYACVYCQLGKAIRMQSARQEFYPVDWVVREVTSRFKECAGEGEPPDYITFVPDGEPALDANLKEEIEEVKKLGANVAVITNASLLSQRSVRSALASADWVSCKVDAGEETLWRKINRPVRDLDFNAITRSLYYFREEFSGTLVTETMLIEGVNDTPAALERTANILRALRPDIAYIAVPTRPPAETWVGPASEKALADAHRIFTGSVSKTEFLIHYEGDNFSSGTSFEEDILSITSVHPMREEAVRKLEERYNIGNAPLEKLIAEEKVKRLNYRGETYYLRNLKKDLS